MSLVRSALFLIFFIGIVIEADAQACFGKASHQRWLQLNDDIEIAEESDKQFGPSSFCTNFPEKQSLLGNRFDLPRYLLFYPNGIGEHCFLR